jgi:hypothetical protein
MTEKSNDDAKAPEFKQIIAAYSDEELRIVLKKRKLYQKDAADFAIHEAIRRGIIYSEQDLFAKEYKHTPNKFSMFPTIENEKTRGKFRKSISRSFLVLGAIPLVFGGIKIFEMQSIEGILIFVLGAAWIFASYQLMRKLDKRLVVLLFVILVFAVAYVVKLLVSTSSLYTIDLLVAVIGIGSVFYGVGFLWKLQQ